jgi:hypothetical protein
MRPNFLRPVRYHGEDDSSSRLSRELSPQLKLLSENPLLGGRLLELQDFSSQVGSINKSYALRHQLHSKANGLLVLECRSKDPEILEPPTYPLHVPSQDTDDVAFVAMTPFMAINFLWSFWVW